MSASDKVAQGPPDVRTPRRISSQRDRCTCCFLLAWPRRPEVLHPPCSTEVSAKEALASSKSPLPLPLYFLHVCKSYE